MLKALLKKQMLEFAAVWLKDRKTGKMRTGGSLAVFVLLFAVIFGMLGVSFGGMFFMFAHTFCTNGMNWLYFALTGLLALLLGVFGDVFNSYASLYLAKDNELLLSMPVKPSYILLARMLSVYLMGFLFEAVVFIPAIIVYQITVGFSAANFIFPVILLFVIGFAVLVLTCVLGYFVAFIATRIKGRAFVTVFCSLAFLGLYYFGYFKVSSFLDTITADPEAFGGKIKGYAYPVYIFGLAGAGDIKALLLTVLAVAAVCALTGFVLSRTFTELATRNRGMKKTAYKEKTAKAAGIPSALLRKELKHLTSSPIYMMNCGLGLIFMIAITAAAVIKADYVRTMIASLSLQLPELLSLYGAAVPAVLCIILCMNQFTAPSVSLEGKNIWILQSLPVDAAEVLKAKARMHIILNGTTSAVCAVILSAVLDSGVLTTAASVALVCAFNAFTAYLGLLLDLHSPDLVWTNENVPVKQNTSVLFSMLGGLAVCIAYAAACWFGTKFIAPVYIMLLFAAVLLAFAYFMRRRVLTKGARDFERL